MNVQSYDKFKALLVEAVQAHRKQLKSSNRTFNDDEYVLYKDCMGTGSSWWRVQVSIVEGQMREKGWNPQHLPPTTH